MIALKMIQMIEQSSSREAGALGWRMRIKTLATLRRQSRHTGDVRLSNGMLTFRGVPIEVANVTNSLGAELIHRTPDAGNAPE
jgi:hypothetical protein